MRSAALVAVFALCAGGSALAEIPQVLGYQGMITDNSGIPVDDDTYAMRFRICTAPTGGTVVWDSGDMSVTTSNGVFSVSLGEAPQPTLDIAFDQDYWLLVTFEGENQTPRKTLGSVGYAYMASGVVPGTEVAGDFYVDGELGVGITSPEAELHVNGDLRLGGGTREFELSEVWPSDPWGLGIISYGGIGIGSDDGGNRQMVMFTDGSGAHNIFTVATSENSGASWEADFTVQQNGRVGIGTTTPGADFDVDGTAQMTGFSMPPGASAGHVLTSDASGVGTWQAPSAVSDGDWTVSGSHMYSAVSGNVGVGMTTPAVKLDVAGSVNTDSLYRIGGDVVLAAEDSVTRVGRGAGANNASTKGTFVGFNAGLNNAAGSYNTFVGGYAGQSNTSGYRNAYFGHWAGSDNTTGNFNTFIGFNAGNGNTTSEFNTFVGSSAGARNTTGYHNTFVGGGAGQNSRTGYDNTFVGSYSGLGNLFGSCNTFVGRYAGYWSDSADSNVCLGHRAGYNEMNSNRLYIENSDAVPSDALIYGEFDNDLLALNAKVGIGTTTPASELDVNGRIELPDNDATGATGSGAIEIGNTLRIDGDEIITDTNTTLVLQHDNNGDLTVDGGTLFVDASTNRIGVGTQSPEYGLDVRGDTRIQLKDGSGNWIALRNDGGSLDFQFEGGNLYVQSTTDGEHILLNPNRNSNVGVGTTLPARALHVRDVMRLEPRSSAPGSPSEGDIYYDSTDHKLKVYDGTGWQACW